MSEKQFLDYIGLNRFKNKLLSDVIAKKQDKLTGGVNQVVGFDANGNAVPVDQSVRVDTQVITKIFTESQTWKNPHDAYIDATVRCFGGGGGCGSAGGGGGGGYMAEKVIRLDPYEEVNITIGTGGQYNVNGGTTSFGTHLSANGGGAGSTCGGTGGTGGGGAYSPDNGGSSAGIGEYGGSGTYGGGGGAGGSAAFVRIEFIENLYDYATLYKKGNTDMPIKKMSDISELHQEYQREKNIVNFLKRDCSSTMSIISIIKAYPIIMQ